MIRGDTILSMDNVDGIFSLSVLTLVLVAGWLLVSKVFYIKHTWNSLDLEIDRQKNNSEL